MYTDAENKLQRCRATCLSFSESENFYCSFKFITNPQKISKNQIGAVQFFQNMSYVIFIYTISSFPEKCSFKNLNSNFK